MPASWASSVVGYSSPTVHGRPSVPAVAPSHAGVEIVLASPVVLGAGVAGVSSTGLRSRLLVMAVATKVPFSDASPAQIREVLLPEELPQFEEQYRQALRVAAETYRLDVLQRTLQDWRRIAWMTQSDPQAHRLMLARADYTLATGKRAPATASASQLRDLLGQHTGR